MLISMPRPACFTKDISTQRLVSLCLTVTLAASQTLATPQTQSQPAFLDSSDQITIWLPEPAKPEDIAKTASVSVDGQAATIQSVSGRQLPEFASTPDQVVLPGSIQAALGAAEWDPNGRSTLMTRVKPGVYEFVGKFPKGSYEYKVARGGTWSENYGSKFEPGGANISLIVPADNTIVKFVVDFNTKTVLDSLNNPTQITPPTTLNPPQTPPETHGFYSSFTVKITKPVPDPSLPITLTLGSKTFQVYSRYILNQPEFVYTKDDLGPTYTKRATTFKVWSPVSSLVDLILLEDGSNSIKTIRPLSKSENGTWTTTVEGDLHNARYAYRYHSYGRSWMGPDIYAKAATADSKFSVVVDLKWTNPPGWPGPRPFKNKSPLEAFIYEMHIRDFTVDSSSGVPELLRGKYLGLATPRTTSPANRQKTGLDYLKWLGVTHVHLLPFQNFNPEHSNQYNWGYETTLFNVPEEQYSTDPQNPLTTIREAKTMIATLQRNGIGVIQDVVYNHSVPSEGDQSAFWAAVPYFYFRTNDRGDVLNESGVGNALNDENPMVRKFIRDSLIFWANEYRLDGFRFDLLGMFTPETIADLANAIRTVNPDAIIYGEPWTGGGPNRSPKGSLKGKNVAVFNDEFRNFFRGGLDEGRAGFIDGASPDHNSFFSLISGSLDRFASTPLESVNYLSAHDNLTLWDAITLSRPDATYDERKASLRLAMAAVLLSQGIPFWEGGAELGRTKENNPNSYNAGDPVNQFDWIRAAEFQDTAEFLKVLIQIRKDHPAFRLPNAEEIRKSVSALPWQNLPQTCIGFQINGRRAKDSWSTVLVVFNLGPNQTSFNLPPGSWCLELSGTSTKPKTLTRVGTLPPYSVNIIRSK